MSKTIRKTDENWESRRKQKEKRNEKYSAKRQFYNEPKTNRKDDEAGEDGRRR